MTKIDFKDIIDTNVQEYIRTINALKAIFFINVNYENVLYRLLYVQKRKNNGETCKIHKSINVLHTKSGIQIMMHLKHRFILYWLSGVLFKNTYLGYLFQPPLKITTAINNEIKH